MGKTRTHPVISTSKLTLVFFFFFPDCVPGLWFKKKKVSKMGLFGNSRERIVSQDMQTMTKPWASPRIVIFVDC